ncbi:TPA: LysR family transcriptional regulator, partial [Shigella flexneri]|nr:LysR family transcriptional regulator [Shigella flexneri]
CYLILWRDSRQTPLNSSPIPQSRRECGYLQS